MQFDIPIKKSEIKFILMILILLFGLTNWFPSEVSVYDEYLIPSIEQSITPEHIFYAHINLLIGFFRILIILSTLIEGYMTIKYGLKYDVFSLRKVVYRSR